MNTYLPCVEIDPKAKPRWTVIWLHGLGADGNDFVPIVPELGLGPGHRVRFVFPHAPAIPVTINGGMVMPAWYDIRHPDLGEREDRSGLVSSVHEIRKLIEREVEKGTQSEHIILAGFSQGGAVAAHTALRYEKELGGLLCLSTYLVDPKSLEGERSEANRGLRIFYGHGSKDPMVPMRRGQEASDLLQKFGYAVEWHTYSMQHEVCQEEIRDVGLWLKSIMT